jgi:transcriptional regulator with XRE-family HTH domain
MKMSVHKQFSENLRAFCFQKGTIADVCRDLDINRQQFSKYLSGASLPNPSTLLKLANYFAVDQIEFFQSPRALRRNVGADPYGGNYNILSANPAVLKHLNSIAAQSTSIPMEDGCYHVHYPWLFDPKQVVRSVLVIFRRDGLTHFRRYTRLQSGQSKKLRQYPKGCHEGLVFRHEGNICFLGRNTVGFGEISLQAFAFENFVAENAITGLGLIATPWGEYCALRATLSYFGPITTFRQAMKIAKIGPIAKDSVPSFVRLSVTSPLTTDIPQLRAFSHDDWLRVMERATAPAEADHRKS